MTQADSGGGGFVIELGGQRRTLPPAAVLPWVQGYAAALGEEPRVAAATEPDAADETQRMQALLAGAEAGWWRFLYYSPGEPERPEP